MTTRQWLWAGGAAAVLCSAGAWWLIAADARFGGPAPLADGAPASGAQARAQALAALPATAGESVTAAASAVAAASAAAAATAKTPVTVELLRKTGALRGTELDGDWGEFAGGVLKPGIRLRQRFDHLLIGIGDVDPAELRAWIAAQVTAQLGERAAEQVLAVWDAYEKLLRSQVGGKAADPTDAAAWSQWIAKRSVERNAALGPAWADAFYAEEHRNLQAFGERMVQRAAAGPGALEPEEAAQRVLLPSAQSLGTQAAAERQAQRVQYFGSEGAQRLADEDKAWAEWNQRLLAARERQAAIAADAQLSPVQRQQALDADLARHFQGTELIRAKGLIRL